jgi:anti-anti-sigma regulatory factor
MPKDTMIHTIPEKFSFDEDISLKVFLRENGESPVEIAAQNLRKADGLLLQYLIAASRVWQNKGLKFELTHVSKELGEAFMLLGIDEKALSWKVAA